MQYLTSASAFPGLQRPQLLSAPQPREGRSVADVVDHARQIAAAVATALTAAATVLVGGAAGSALVLDAEDAAAAGVRLGARPTN